MSCSLIRRHTSRWSVCLGSGRRKPVEFISKCNPLAVLNCHIFINSSASPFHDTTFYKKHHQCRVQASLSTYKCENVCWCVVCGSPWAFFLLLPWWLINCMGTEMLCQDSLAFSFLSFNLFLYFPISYRVWTPLLFLIWLCPAKQYPKSFVDSCKLVCKTEELRGDQQGTQANTNIHS